MKQNPDTHMALLLLGLPSVLQRFLSALLAERRPLSGAQSQLLHLAVSLLELLSGSSEAVQNVFFISGLINLAVKLLEAADL